MRRVTATLLLSLVLVLPVLMLPVLATAILGPGTLAAAVALPADQVVVAAEGAEGEEVPGLEPADRNPESPQQPDAYDPSFLWGAAVGLAVLSILGVAALAGMYWLMVLRPAKEA